MASIKNYEKYFFNRVQVSFVGGGCCRCRVARVNRVFQDKEGGLVVDYVGIASALKQAMNDYTVRDRENYGEMDVAKRAYPKFQEKLEICRNLFFGYDYDQFYDGTDLQRGMTLSGAVNFMVSPTKEEQKQAFVKEALMLKQSVKSEGVINLFSDVGEEFNLFDTKFLADVARMKNKNLAVEMLKKLIAEQVKVYKRTNLVKSEKFSELVQQTLNRYLNGLLTNEQVKQTRQCTATVTAI